MNKTKKKISTKHKDAFETYKKEMGITEDTDINAMKPEDYAIYNTYKTAFEKEQQANNNYIEGETALNENVAQQRQQNLAMYDRVRKYLPQQIAQGGMSGLGVAQDTMINANNMQVSGLQNINKMYNNKYNELGSVYEDYMKNLGDTTANNLYVGQQNKNIALDNEAQNKLKEISKQIEQVESNVNLDDNAVAEQIISILDKYKDVDFRSGQKDFQETYDYYKGQLVQPNEDGAENESNGNKTGNDDELLNGDEIEIKDAYHDFSKDGGKQEEYYNKLVEKIATDENAVGKIINMNYGYMLDDQKGFYKVVKGKDGKNKLVKYNPKTNGTNINSSESLYLPDGYKINLFGYIVKE